MAGLLLVGRVLKCRTRKPVAEEEMVVDMPRRRWLRAEVGIRGWGRVEEEQKPATVAAAVRQLGLCQWQADALRKWMAGLLTVENV